MGHEVTLSLPDHEKEKVEDSLGEKKIIFSCSVESASPSVW